MDKFFSNLALFGVEAENIHLIYSSKYKLNFVFTYKDRLVVIFIYRSILKGNTVFYFDWQYKRQSGRAYSISELANDIKNL